MQEPIKSCLRCNGPNPVSAAFCHACGAHFPPPVAYQKPKKGSGTTLLIVCGVLVFGCAGLTAIGKLAKEYVSKSSARQAPAPEYVSTSAAEARPNAGLTKANYDRIQTGMTYDQVRQILGGYGTEKSRNKAADSETVMYEWKAGDTGGVFAVFENGRLFHINQYGLK